jgi:hypothetical protein
MNEVVAIEDMVVVSRFDGRRMGERKLREWIYANWEPQLPYSPMFYILSWGCMALIFHMVMDVEKVLDSYWKLCLTPLSLKNGHRFLMPKKIRYE